MFSQALSVMKEYVLGFYFSDFESISAPALRKAEISIPVIF